MSGTGRVWHWLQKFTDSNSDIADVRCWQSVALAAAVQTVTLTLLMSGAGRMWHWLQQFADSNTDTADVRCWQGVALAAAVHRQ
jgi:uncharacterized protein YecA (UPF0149 family)